MKATVGFMAVVMAALMFLIPKMQAEKSLEREAQEEAPYEEVLEKENAFRIIYEASTPDESAIADIKWMEKAAKASQEMGIPYFNVLDQRISKKFSREFNQDLAVVEGTIQLDDDPMRAQYHAYEIEELMLTGFEEGN